MVSSSQPFWCSSLSPNTYFPSRWLPSHPPATFLSGGWKPLHLQTCQPASPSPLGHTSHSWQVFPDQLISYCNSTPYRTLFPIIHLLLYFFHSTGHHLTFCIFYIFVYCLCSARSSIMKELLVFFVPCCSFSASLLTEATCRMLHTYLLYECMNE